MNYESRDEMGGDLAWEAKVWGDTRCTVSNDVYSRHLLRLNAGGFCSFHYHEHRANRFHILHGVVRIVWAFGWKLHYKDLSANNSFVIESLVPHQFQVLESGKMVEEYWPDRNGLVDGSDIIRLTQGNQTDPTIMRKDVGVFCHDGSFWDGRRKRLVERDSE